ncbi:hypothetical protein H1Z61_03760 [Bacillus aquiflavi]|uniref:Uncharacterized protein n=1 Tax=Bacillus aquiflavi TaxID=2672567 RepID=A0A6B3VYL6_9BACI|nr:hypothetical protein [Bacillus aquiflavi]MBA4536278.1 hypothetical protein [Bacillus aquiflavi]NEY80646.1 hypothetical protein [Bacillus aquiflavi]UAC49457.1 hypothetical protein K6959_06345 [Bacillus aquiflavi]
MSIKTVFFSIMIHGLLAYCCILLVSGVALLENKFLIVVLLFIFVIFANKLYPFKQYKMTDPVKIIGFIAFFVILFVHFNVMKLSFF